MKAVELNIFEDFIFIFFYFVLMNQITNSYMFLNFLCLLYKNLLTKQPSEF